ncbi:MAG: hypothetical protein M3Y33_04140 [Actinomycetota bacterium]|nr:hypothetical protein [Actinomycetota bacterium]
MDQRPLKSLARSMVIGLAVVIALAGFNIGIPKGRSAGSNWRFAATHPTILFHIICATLVLVGAVALLVKSWRSHRRSWTVLSIAGLVFLLLAFVYGEQYIMTLQESALTGMSLGWLGAIVTYCAGWYLGRKGERQYEHALKSDSSGKVTRHE